MNRLQLEIEFRRRGVMTAKELAATVGVSQPTVSRLLASAGRERIHRLGRGRATRYAMARSIRGLGSMWPLYEVRPSGEVQLAGRLHALEPGAWLFEQDDPWETMRGSEFRDGLYPSFPWFLDDLRPQGFLGRCFVRTHAAALGLPADIRLWSPGDTLTALIRQGQDLQGSFILGEDMLSAFQSRSLADESDAVLAGDRLTAYPTRAEIALAGGWPGSSAAGEQPKFTARVKDPDGTVRHTLVKFSGREGRAENQRWSDLLVAEHLAARLLSQHGISAARTSLMQAGGRCFLEADRFDRVGVAGRRGLVSLAALDSAFFGQPDTPWTSAADRLREGGWITGGDAEQLTVLWWFGVMIGNTDMHYGNASLYLDQRRPLSLAPAYDMVPMVYRPDIEGGLPDRPLTPQPPPPEALPLWSRAAALAEEFWQVLVDAPNASPAFRTIAGQNATVVSRHRQRFAGRT